MILHNVRSDTLPNKTVFIWSIGRICSILATMKTEIIRLSGNPDDEMLIKNAASLIEQGGLVAFPTETVYGIGCIVQPKAIERLNEAKGRPSEKRYTLHIPDKSCLLEYIPHVPLRARKLVDKVWPGPLTIVFELDKKALEDLRKKFDAEVFEILYQDATIGIRCPDHRSASALLSAVSKPVVAPSANLAGDEPATTLEQVLANLDGRIDMVLTGPGPDCRYGGSSTVVRVNNRTLSILREGVLSREEIEEISSIRLLFVCTGNTCRSPMAEAFCRKYMSEKLKCNIDDVGKMGYKVASAGVMAVSGIGASREVVDICKEMGIDATAHRSRFLTSAEIEESDYIFVMSTSHRDRVLELCPEAAQKCMLLDENSQVSDPIGGGREVYEKCAKQIERALEKRVNGILK